MKGKRIRVDLECEGYSHQEPRSQNQKDGKLGRVMIHWLILSIVVEEEK